MKHADPAEEVAVYAPARLHFGFLDLEGGLGRRFGSLGLAIEGIGTRLVLRRAQTPAARGPAAARALAALGGAAALLGVPPGAEIDIIEAIPEHAGLGSGTQLGLAVAAGLARLHGIPARLPMLAGAVRRGARSGIGIGAFSTGGFLVDGGRVEGAAEPAPIVARLAFPAHWRLLLMLDPARHGLHGEAELAAFATLPGFAEAQAGRLCRLVLMRLLPGLATSDFAAVSSALGALQDVMAEHFGAAQAGRYSSPAVAEAMDLLAAEGIAGLGQSSWGPTGFALIESAAEAERLAARLARRFEGAGGLACRVVAGRNRGAEIGASMARHRDNNLAQEGAVDR